MKHEREEQERKDARNYLNSLGIDKDVFCKTSTDNESEDLHLALSRKYMIFKDYSERSMLNPQHIGK